MDFCTCTTCVKQQEWTWFRSRPPFRMWKMFRLPEFCIWIASLRLRSITGFNLIQEVGQGHDGIQRFNVAKTLYKEGIIPMRKWERFEGRPYFFFGGAICGAWQGRESIAQICIRCPRILNVVEYNRRSLDATVRMLIVNLRDWPTSNIVKAKTSSVSSGSQKEGQGQIVFFFSPLPHCIYL